MTPLVEELVPCPGPWDVARKLAHLPHLLFLDSAERHPERGRYSYVMADPRYWYADEVWRERSGFPRLGRQDFISRLSDHAARNRGATVPGVPPFRGGYAGLFGYGLHRQLERIPESRYDDLQTPDVAVGVYTWVVAFDHAAGRGWVVADDPRVSRLGAYRGRVAEAVRRVKALVTASDVRPPRGLRAGTRATPVKLHPLPGIPDTFSNFTPDSYRAAVRRAVEYIHAGDCFQVNLSQRLLAPLTEHPLDLYGRLRERNPAPFGCYFDAGDFQVLSASPERFLQVSPAGEVVAQPIKGTRPRGRTPDEDAALVRELTGSEKDRAENVMIVDLLRNDLGRVCEFGSVRVPRVCDLETYRYVHHLVSEVRGKLRPGTTPFDLLRAAFPGGSVTGAPKVRAMEVIAELEPTARGPYCGGVGFVGFDGSMDMNILIRTFTAGRGWVQFPVGGGVVADSDPAREYEETLHKAAGLLRALHP